MKALCRIVAMIPLLAVNTVIAHEGHGHPAYSDGPMHYVVNPSHSLGALLVVAAVAVAAGSVIRRRNSSR